MTDKEYREQTWFVFVPPQNPDDYPLIIENAQEQALVTENLLKKVFLSPLVEQLTGFGQVYALTMPQHMFPSYGAINGIDLKEYAVMMMGPYNPREPLPQSIKKIEKGR